MPFPPAARQKKYIIVILVYMRQASLGVIFSHLSKNSVTELSPTLKTAWSLCPVIQDGSGLEQLSSGWRVSRTLHRRGGCHGSDGVGAIKRKQGGKRSQQGDRNDEFMSHLIDWQPYCAYCGNRFSLWAGETREFTRGLILKAISMLVLWGLNNCF